MSKPANKDEHVDKLNERVSHRESILFIAKCFAAFLGLSGAGLAVLLFTASVKVATLQGNIGELNTGLEKMARDAIAKSLNNQRPGRLSG